MKLSTPVAELFMIGPAYERRLKKLGIETVGDLLYHFPFRYVDYSLISPIARIQPGEIVSIKGKLISIKNEYTRHGKKLQKAVVKDHSGTIDIIWFNQPFLVKILKIGSQVNLSGRADWFNRKVTLVSPEYETQKRGESIHTGRLVPVYHETYGLSSKWLRSRIAPLIKSVVPQIKDFLPDTLLKKYELIELKKALKQIHFPHTKKEADQALSRFAFEELFLIQLAALERKKSWQKQKLAYQFSFDQEKILKFTQSLPFELTSAQKRVLREIFTDLVKTKPMNRLLEGDVGSGKTVVAAAACYIAFLNGTQSALMAPTEILAQQHYQTLDQLLTPLGVKISLLTSARKKINPQFDLLIGTHALIHKRAKFQKLGFVVIDEQHRFGVEQRAQLIQRGKAPHVLTMTATPIPRTIALTLYGDLDLSVIDEMPPGRIRVKTWVVPHQKREAAYQWIKKHVKGTEEQAFIICPLIEESETLKAVKAVKVEFENLSKKIFPDLRLGLLHGRLKSKEKDEVIQKFREGKLDILVSTPVVEVGIDIPQATIMMIEGADRFGLAQLHQLRGRVGRSKKESYCLLFTEKNKGSGSQRLKAMEKIYIGMELADFDLKMRGPGEIYGTRQHGFPDLRAASFTDFKLIKKTKEAAEKTFNKIHLYPCLKEKIKEDTIKQIEPN